MEERRRAENDTGPNQEMREKAIEEAIDTCQCTDLSHREHRGNSKCENTIGYTTYFYHAEDAASNSNGWIAICWLCALQIIEEGGKVYR